jgi:hypothetical protein
MFAFVSLALVVGVRAKADVTLSLSAPSYEVGEVVSFVLTNQTEWMIQLPQGPGWTIRDSLGAYVAPCKITPAVIDMYPGWSFDWDWDQRDCQELQVPPGRYRVKIDYSCDGCPIYDNSVESWFSIGMVPTEPASWGRLKATFRGN